MAAIVDGNWTVRRRQLLLPAFLALSAKETERWLLVWGLTPRECNNTARDVAVEEASRLPTSLRAGADIMGAADRLLFTALLHTTAGAQA